MLTHSSIIDSRMTSLLRQASIRAMSVVFKSGSERKFSKNMAIRSSSFGVGDPEDIVMIDPDSEGVGDDSVGILSLEGETVSLLGEGLGDAEEEVEEERVEEEMVA